MPYGCLLRMRRPPRPYCTILSASHLLLDHSWVHAYQSTDGQASGDRGHGASSDVTCDAAACGKGAKEESKVIERLQSAVSGRRIV